MSYATQADLCPAFLSSKTLMELTDDVKAGEIVPAVVTAKLAEASGVIEMWCRERYALPLQQTAELTALCCAIAVYKLYSRRPGDPPKVVEQAYTDALNALKAIAAKKASLDQPAPSAAAQSSSNTIAVSRKDQPFGRCKMEGYL